MRQILRTSGVQHVVIAVGQLYGFAIGPVDLRLEEKVGGEPFRGIRIQPVQTVSDLERRHGRTAVLILDPQRNLAGWKGIKENRDVIAETDILGTLADIE